MKFANLSRETKIILMDEQSALIKLRGKLEEIGRNITKKIKYTEFRTHTIFDEKCILLSILVKFPSVNLSHFSVVIDINDDNINSAQQKMLEFMKKHLTAENYKPEF